MKEKEYIAFARDFLIKKEIEKINNMSFDDIFEKMQKCPDCGESVVSIGQIKSAVSEGFHPHEVEKMLCVQDHCNVTSSKIYFEDDDRVDLNTGDLGIDDLKADNYLDDEEDEITSRFRGAISRLCEKKNVAFSICFLYSDDDKKMNDKNVRGRVFQFGDHTVIKRAIEDLRSSAEKNVGDDGIVFDL